jgi:hypothetical protein
MIVSRLMIELFSKPMYMIRGLTHALLFLSLFWQASDLCSQGKNTYASRDAFYDSLEARAQALSKRLAEVSGTAPIPFERPAPTILSTMKPSGVQQTQSTFDALPGPNLKPVTAGPVDNTLYRADGTPVVVIPREQASAPPEKISPEKFLEGARGRYFLQPFVGLALIGSEVNYSKTLLGDSSNEVDVETAVGSTVGLAYGRRWNNLEGELHFSYSHLGYKSITISEPVPGGPFDTDGNLEVFQIGARIGYGIPFGESGWIRAAGGFGYGKRKDYVSFTDPDLSNIDGFPLYENNSVFTYDLLLSLGYEMAMGLDAFLAYRLLGTSDNGDFGSVAMHLFELGLGANF